MGKCFRHALIPILAFAITNNAQACCAVAAAGVPVVNADQTVIIWWDKANQMEHFIRKASFRGGGESIGFLVPTPSRPQLEESGNEAFRHLAEITAPKVSSGGGFPIGCSVASPPPQSRGVRLIEEKTVAGFDAVVLAADSGKELVEWLRQRDYVFTPEAAAWAQPYLTDGWHITAMKVTKDREARLKSEVSASALRISFKTDRPIFPYREPDSRIDAARLGAGPPSVTHLPHRGIPLRGPIFLGKPMVGQNPLQPTAPKGPANRTSAAPQPAGIHRPVRGLAHRVRGLLALRQGSRRRHFHPLHGSAQTEPRPLRSREILRSDLGGTHRRAPRAAAFPAQE